SPRREPEPVYNIEVEGDHCYRVGQQGLLVHNASTDAYFTMTVTMRPTKDPAGPRGACGGFQAQVKWGIEGPGKDTITGAVIQRVELDVRDPICNRRSDPTLVALAVRQLQWYEAWKVVNGVFQAPGDLDNNRWPSKPHSAGTFQALFWVMF